MFSQTDAWLAMHKSGTDLGKQVKDGLECIHLMYTWIDWDYKCIESSSVM